MNTRRIARTRRAWRLCGSVIGLLAELALVLSIVQQMDRVALTSARAHRQRSQSGRPLESLGMVSITPAPQKNKRVLRGMSADILPHHVIEHITALRADERCTISFERENIGPIERMRAQSNVEGKRQTVIIYELTVTTNQEPPALARVLSRTLTLTGELPGSIDRPYERIEHLIGTISVHGHFRWRMEYTYRNVQSNLGGVYSLAAYTFETEGILPSYGQHLSPILSPCR